MAFLTQGATPEVPVFEAVSRTDHSSQFTKSGSSP